MSTRFPGGMAVSQGVTGLDAQIGGRLANVAPGAAVTNTTTRTASASEEIPANALTTGRSYRVRWCGRATATNGSDTLTFTLLVGGVVFLATAAVDVANGDKFMGEATIAALEAPSADSACVAYGYYTDPAGTTLKPFQTVPTDVATDAAVVVSGSLTWSAASASDSARLDHFSVEVI